MSISLRFWLSLLWGVLLTSRGGAGVETEAVRAADDERVSAMIAGDRQRLEAIISDELRYAHASGKTDTKTSLIETLVSGRKRYERFDYLERNFSSAAPGAVAMSGRMMLQVSEGGKTETIPVSFLCVWRLEDGRWRFLAWQSSRMSSPSTPVVKP